MLVLKTYLYSHEARLDHAKLTEEGIESFIFDENIVTINPVYANAVGGIKLMVREEDFEKAGNILKTEDYGNLANEFPGETIEELKRCKKCGSTNIFQKSSWLIGLFFLILYTIPFGKPKNRFACLDCRYEWKETNR